MRNNQNWTTIQKVGDWIRFWSYKRDRQAGVGIMFISRRDAPEGYKAVVIGSNGSTIAISDKYDSISQARNMVQRFMDEIDDGSLDMTMESIIHKIDEAFENYTYSPSADKKELLFDFYLLSFLQPPQDDKDLEIALEESKTKLYKYLKRHMLDAVYFAISAEFRHMYDENSMSELLEYFSSKGHKDFFVNYSKYYLSKTEDNVYKLDKFKGLGFPIKPEDLEEPKLKEPMKGEIGPISGGGKYKGIRGIMGKGEYRRSYQAAKKTGISDAEFVNLAKDAFIRDDSTYDMPKDDNRISWRSSYAGDPWRKICNGWLQLNNAKDDSNNDLSVWIDHVYDLQHNTSTVFNKLIAYYKKGGYSWLKEALDWKLGTRSPYEFFDRVSPDLREFASYLMKNAGGYYQVEPEKTFQHWQKQQEIPNRKRKKGELFPGDEVEYNGRNQLDVKAKKTLYAGTYGKVVEIVPPDEDTVVVNFSANMGTKWRNTPVQKKDLLSKYLTPVKDSKKSEPNKLEPTISNEVPAEIGDKIEIVTPGLLYTGYKEIAKLMGAKNYQVDQYSSYNKQGIKKLEKGVVGTVKGYNTHLDNPDAGNVYLIELENGDEITINHKGIKKIEKIPTPPASKFTVGDTVKYTGKQSDQLIGLTGKVTKVGTMIKVNFKDAPSDMDYSIYPYNIELVKQKPKEEPKEEPKEGAKEFKVGDKVKYTGTHTIQIQGLVGKIIKIDSPNNIQIDWGIEGFDDYGVYPKNIELVKPDKEIDHADTPNLSVGDKVKYTGTEQNPSHYKTGDTGTVVSITYPGKENEITLVKWNQSGKQLGVYSKDLVKYYYTKKSTKKQTRGFAEGDKVKFIGDKPGFERITGKTGIVKKVHGTYAFVDFGGKDTWTMFLKDLGKVKTDLTERVDTVFEPIINEMNIGKGLATLGIGAAALFGPLGTAQAKQVPSITMQEKQIDKEKLLHALKHVESSGGIDKRDRYEKGVDKQLHKRYKVLIPRTKDAINKYGFKAVATSYGPYQIMASTAYDLGFTGVPTDLRNEATCKIWVSKLLDKIIASKKTNNIRDVISAYNAGLGRIGTNPDYINKVLKYYK